MVVLSCLSEEFLNHMNNSVMFFQGKSGGLISRRGVNDGGERAKKTKNPATVTETAGKVAIIRKGRFGPEPTEIGGNGSKPLIPPAAKETATGFLARRTGDDGAGGWFGNRA